MMKKIIFLFILTVSSICTFAQKKHNCQEKHKHHSNQPVYDLDSRSDSIDITHIELDLDFHELDGMLSASATIEFMALVNNIEKIDLDLLNFTVDSVVENGASLAFDYDSELLEVNISNELQINELTTINIYYHGEPTTDGSGFGGLDYTSGYAYNMGVGFLADPHPFGRSWFPCFDNFVERSTYTFNVLTDSTNYAYCNGEFIARTFIGEDSLITTWEMEYTIPSYLASIGVSNYTHVEQNYEGALGDVPVFLIAKPQDTTNMKNSFVNLPTAFSTYENRFGPYRWNKVGYNLVPNNGGAMEHATNIAYPRILSDGSLTYQSIMAHELAHHWWGDLVTCSTQEDMWINEGMASYCEQLFFESLGGETSYIEHVRDNHKNVFFDAHLDDGAWLPVSGIGTENTYGSTVYNKGSDVGHVLRSYLGDDDFFEILTNFLDDNEFSHVSSEDLRDYIINSGTAANMNAYFDNWIFNPGFPSFEIRSQEILSGGADFEIDLSIDQSLHHAPENYTDVPMVVRVIDSQYNIEDFDVLLTGESTDLTITTSLFPKKIYLNPKDKISQGVFGDDIQLTETGLNDLSYSEFKVRVLLLGDEETYWFRSECHYSDADPNDLTNDYVLSDDRFWRIRMFGSEESPDTEIEGEIKFNGNENSATFRDETFFIEMENLGLNEDSLVLMYREFGDTPWTLYSSYELNTSGTNSNWVGYLTILELKSGDYTWAYKNPDVYVAEESALGSFKFLQNEMWIDVNGLPNQSCFFTLYDSIGRAVMSDEFIESTQIYTDNLSKGNYVLKVTGRDIINEETFSFNITN